MSEPTLLICLGATKTGTSWLHRYFANHDQAHMRGIKELHYFDAVEFGDWDHRANELRDRRDANLAELQTLPAAQAAVKRLVARDADEWMKVLRARREDDDAYLDYLTKGMAGAQLVADFTPSYGLLPKARLAKMNKIARDVRFIYLLRDPVDRVWSHARMIAKMRAPSVAEIQSTAQSIVKRMLAGLEPEVVRRSDYSGPIARLREVVAEDRLFLGFYEDLFTKKTVSRISKFAGIELGWADYSKRIMEGPKAEMAAGQWTQLRDYLSPQYDAMARMLGKLPKAWGREEMKVA